MIGVQPKGSSPLVLAYNRRDPHVNPIASAHTIASGLKTTFSGDHALRAIYESGGCAIEIEDAEILKYKQLLAELEGLWVETSSAITAAALPKLLESGVIHPEEKVICVLTGAGHKEDTDIDMEQSMDTADLDPDDIIGKYSKLTT
jgi:threonine synthase